MIINRRLWRIFFVSADHPVLLTSSGTYTLGVCDGNENAIYISLGLPRTKLKKVLCHEIVHAAMFSYNVNMTIEQEEMVADLIATFGKEILFNTNQIFDDIT